MGLTSKARRLSQSLGQQDLQIASLVNETHLNEMKTDRVFQLSLESCGIDFEDLIPKPFSEFAYEPNSPIRRTSFQQREAFRSFERSRVQCVAIVQAAMKSQAQELLKEEEELKEKEQQKLENAYKKISEREGNLLRKRDIARSKLEKVIVQENSNILEKHARFEEQSRLAQQKERERQNDALSEARRRARAMQARQERLEEVRQQAHYRLTMDITDLQRKNYEKELRVQWARERQQQALQEEIEERKAKRLEIAQRRADKLADMEEEREKIRQGLLDKSTVLEEISWKKQARLSDYQALKRFRTEEKHRKARRLRREHQAKSKRKVERLERWQERMEEIEEMKIAAEKKRKDEAAKRLIESHKFAEEHPLQREISPGPGAYNIAPLPERPRSHPAIKSAPPSSTFLSRTTQQGSSYTKTRGQKQQITKTVELQKKETKPASYNQEHWQAKVQSMEPSSAFLSFLSEDPEVRQLGEDFQVRLLHRSRVLHPPSSTTSSKERLGSTLSSTTQSLKPLPKVSVTTAPSTSHPVAKETLTNEMQPSPSLNRYSRQSGVRYMPHMDVKMRTAAFLPGPGQYQTQPLPTSPVARWGDQKVKSDIEIQMQRAKDMPGPAEYSPSKLKKSSSVRFGRTQAKSEFDWLIMRAKELPGPSDYGIVTKRQVRRFSQIGKTLSPNTEGN